jgi:Flp pilus assembly protein TadD
VQRRFPESVAAFAKAVEIAPNRGDLFQALGDVYKQMGKSKESDAAYARAATLGVKPDASGKGSEKDSAKEKDKKKKKS